jgi:hypothetical protein
MFYTAVGITVLGGVLIALFLLLRFKFGLAEHGLVMEIYASPEVLVHGPTRGSFRGADREYGKVKCDGRLYLTDQRLIMLTATGRRIELPLAEIADATIETSFHGAVRLGQPVLVVHLRDGNRVGFFAPELEQWQQVLLSRRSPRNSPLH